jgi:hypothetical protein
LPNDDSGHYQSLTGVWSGYYGYITLHGMPYNAFTAMLIDSGGSLSGTIHEDMQWDGRIFPAEATMKGHRYGAEVSFVKSYEGALSQMHKIAYEGVLNAAGDQFQGQWRILTTWGVELGRFVMTRNRPKAKAKSAGVTELEKA